MPRFSSDYPIMNLSVHYLTNSNMGNNTVQTLRDHNFPENRLREFLYVHGNT